MTMFGRKVNVVVTVYFIGEVIGKDAKGNEIIKKVTRDFDSREEALNQKMMMGYGRLCSGTKEI